MDEKSIWNERQNKPTLIVRDLAPFVDQDFVYEVLLRRGVFKWLSARRKIIKLKNTWKARITASIAEQKETKNWKRREWLRGYRKGLEECRAEVREVCHATRWEAPDFDKQANEWLENYSQNPPT